ncbi:unnamed protein product [Symbiodinium sp. CCMP2592]|nr:unnamed protein product [Symbiodinium sp. CCMP2592]
MALLRRQGLQSQPLQRASTTVTGARGSVLLSRACTLTLPSPTGFHVPATQHRQAIVLQRTGTVTLAESAPGLTAPPAQQPAEPWRSAGTVKIPEMAGTAAPTPAPVKSIDAQATCVRRMPTKEDLPEMGRLLFQSMLGPLEEEQPRQLRLVIGGLTGSGKSTICCMLRHLLAGVWIQDEFGSQTALLKAIAEAAADDAVPVLVVDEMQHRTGIVQEMQKGRPGDIVYVQIKHPDDAVDRWENTLDWCASRIARRGSGHRGHRTLMADHLRLRSILQRTAQAAEPLSKEEVRNFAATLRVNMAQTSIAQVTKLLQDLHDAWLEGILESGVFVHPSVEDAVFGLRAAPLPKIAGRYGQRAKELGLLEPRCLQKHRLLQAQHVRDQESAASDACNDERDCRVQAANLAESQLAEASATAPLLHCLCLLFVPLWSSATRQLTGRSVAFVAASREKT